MNDQQKFLRDTLDATENSIDKNGRVTKGDRIDLLELDALASQEQEKENIPFDWLFEFRAEINSLLDSDAAMV